MAIILPFFEEWSKKGLLIDKPAKILAETTQAVIFLIHFKDKIVDDDFSEIMNILIDMLANNNVKKKI